MARGNIMKSIFAVLFVLLGAAADVSAVSWSPTAAEREEKNEKGIRSVGDVVCLFQSGTADIQKIVHVGDIIVVYRESRDHRAQRVGAIRILSYVGSDYIKAEVIEGELIAGDVAKKAAAASLVLSSDDRCKE